MSRQYNIALIPGDGIGPEAIREAVRVLKHIESKDSRFSFAFREFPWGCDFYLRHGKMMDDDGMEILKDYDAILLGAIGSPEVPDHISLRNLLLRIRHDFDEYVNLRPIKLLEGAPTPLKDARREEIDMIFVRKTAKGNMPEAVPGCIRTARRKSSFRTGCFPERDASASSAMPMSWRGRRSAA